jgi:hypothetical protein
MTQLSGVLVYLAGWLSPLLMLAAVHTLPRGLADVTVPNQWKVTTTKGQLEAVSPGGALTLLLRDAKERPDLPPMPRAFARVEEFEPDGEPERIKFNGFTGYVQRGRGRVHGKPVSGERIVLSHRLRKFTVNGWVYAADKDFDRERRQRARSIVKSLRPVP